MIHLLSLRCIQTHLSFCFCGPLGAGDGGGKIKGSRALFHDSIEADLPPTQQPSSENNLLFSSSPTFCSCTFCLWQLQRSALAEGGGGFWCYCRSDTPVWEGEGGLLNVGSIEAIEILLFKNRGTCFASADTFGVGRVFTASIVKIHQRIQNTTLLLH